MTATIATDVLFFDSSDQVRLFGYVVRNCLHWLYWKVL